MIKIDDAAMLRHMGRALTNAAKQLEADTSSEANDPDLTRIACSRVEDFIEAFKEVLPGEASVATSHPASGQSQDLWVNDLKRLIKAARQTL